MSAIKCLTGKVATGLVASKKVETASKRLDEMMDALTAQGEDVFTARIKAEARLEEELTNAAAKTKWRLVNRVRVAQDLAARVAKVDPKKMEAFAINLMDDIGFEGRAEHKRIMSRVADFMERQRTTLMGKVRDPQSFREVMRVLFGENTSDATAKAMGDAIHDTNEWIRKTLNSYGYSIGKLDNYGLPHSHNRMTIADTGFDAWLRQIDGKLDWPKMRDPRTGLEFGAVPGEAYRTEFLQGAYDNIVYGRDSDTPTWGSSAEGNILERHRVFAFKSSDDWLAYNDKFGSADPHSTLLMHWDQMARHIAIARRLGPTPETAMDYLGGLVAERARTTRSGIKAALDGNGGVEHAKRMLRVMEGGIGPQSLRQMKTALYMATTRKLLTAAFLDRAIVISVPSDLNSMRLAAETLGESPTNMLTFYSNFLKDAVAGGTMTRKDLLQMGHVLESWANPGVTTSRFQAEYPAAVWANNLSNAAMRVQGLTQHTEAAKMATQWFISGRMASYADLPFKDVPEGFRRALEDTGITAADWDAFRSGPKFTAGNGAEFLDPIYWQAAQGSPSKATDDIYLKFQTFSEKWGELSVPSGSLIAQGLMDPKAWGHPPGSVPYEFWKSLGMFKSFPAAFVVNQVRMFRMQKGAIGKGWYAFNLAASATIVGALALQVNELLMGRDPQRMDIDFAIRAMLKGGAFGPIGDLISAGSTSWGGGLAGYVLGPLPGAATDTGGLFANLAIAAYQATLGDGVDEDLMMKIFDYQRHYTPMWQTPAALGGAALERMFTDQLLLMLDPDAIDAMAERAQRRQNLYGGGQFWMPGSPLPTRAPDLSTAIPQ